jgi:hypothetical protein
MMGVAPKRRIGERFFGRTVDFVLRNSPCRVIISSDRPQQPAGAPAAAAGGRVPAGPGAGRE